MSQLLLLLALLPHLAATLFGRHLVLRGAGVPLKQLRIDGATWRNLSWQRRLGTFAVPLLIDALLVSALLLLLGFSTPVATTESLVNPTPDGAAAAAGLQPGDRVVAIEGAPITTFEQLRVEVARGAAKQAALAVEVERDGVRRTVEIKHRNGLLGVRAATRNATFSEAVSHGASFVSAQLRGLFGLLASSPDVKIGGPKEIAEIMEQTPPQGKAYLLLMLLTMATLYSVLIVPLLCAIGTPWRSLFRRAAS